MAQGDPCTSPAPSVKYCSLLRVSSIAPCSECQILLRDPEHAGCGWSDSFLSLAARAVRFVGNGTRKHWRLVCRKHLSFVNISQSSNLVKLSHWWTGDTNLIVIADIHGQSCYSQFTISWLRVGVHGKSDIKLIVLQHSYQYIRGNISDLRPDILVTRVTPANIILSPLHYQDIVILSRAID